MNRWLLRAPERPDAPWQWHLAGRAEVLAGTLAEFAQQRAQSGVHAVCLLLPATQALAVTANVPVRQQRQMQSAFPYLIEENLAGDIDQCQVVAGRRVDERRLQLVAVERAVLSAALSALRDHGIDPPVATVESLLLPVPSRGVTLLLDGEHSLLAGSEGQALAFDQADAAAVVSLLGLGAGDVLDVRLGEHGDALLARALESDASAGEVAIDVRIDDTPRPRLLQLATSGRLPVNLRQGAFAPAGSGALSPGFHWQPLAWLAACWLVLFMGWQLTTGYLHEQAAESVRTQQVTLYRQLFPQVQNVNHPRRQLEAKLRGSSGGASFTALVAKTADTLAALAEKDPGRYQPRSLGWDEGQGELRMDILARGLDDIEPLRLALQQAGLVVEVGTGVSQTGGYKARLNIGMARAAAGVTP